MFFLAWCTFTVWVATVQSHFQLLKLLEDILIMQKSVGKLLLEDISLQVVLDTLLDDWQVENAVDIGTSTRDLLQAKLDDILECK